MSGSKRKFNVETQSIEYDFDNNTDIQSSMSQENNMFTVKIDSNAMCYDKLNEFLCNIYLQQSTNEPLLLNLSDVKTREDNNKITYKMPFNKTIELDFNGTKIMCCVKQISKDHGGNYNVIRLHQITLSCHDKDIIEKILFECQTNKDKKIIYHYKTAAHSFHEFGKVQKRDESTLILNQHDKDKILNDVKKFTESKKIYERYGIFYKKNYLFFGVPGSGKTSLVNVIAGKTDRSIYIISFDAEMTDGHLYNAMNGIEENSILLLEDIDCVFHDRNTNRNNSKVSFSALLNILDGVTKIDGLITIITTNHVERLDPALIRPGRIDMSLKFTYISEEQIIGLLKLYDVKLNDKNMKELIKKCTLNALSPAVLSAFMFRSMDKNLNDSNYMQCFNEYLKEIKMGSGSGTHDSIESMYI